MLNGKPVFGLAETSPYEKSETSGYHSSISMQLLQTLKTFMLFNFLFTLYQHCLRTALRDNTLTLKSIAIIAESKAAIISAHVYPLCLIKLCVPMQRLPERIVEKAVKGMLPKGRLGRQLFNHLKVFKGSKHPHQAQKAKDVTNIINLKPEQLAKALTPNTGV